MIIAPQPPALMAFRDDFDRADSTDIGTDWRPDYDNCKIVTNRVQCSTPAANTARQGAWESYVSTTDYNGGRLLTDNWAVEAQLQAPVGNQASNNTTSIGGCMMDTIGAGMVLVYVAMSTGIGHAIITYSASGIASPGTSDTLSGQTARAGGATNIANTSLVRLERRMYSATQSTITFYVNGGQLTQWNDSGGVLPAGTVTRRRWFIQAESNYPFFQSPFYSPAIAWARAYDLKQ